MAVAQPPPGSTPLRVVSVPGKGRGLRAGRRFSCDEVVDAVPVLVIPGREWELAGQTVLARFAFAWDDATGSMALALGRVSLLNHSYKPNLFAQKRVASRMIDFTALRDIEAGEELTINYHGEATCKDPLGFEVKP